MTNRILITLIILHCAFVLPFAIFASFNFWITQRDSRVLNYSAQFFKIFTRVFIIRGYLIPNSHRFATCFCARSFRYLAKVFAFLSLAVYVSPFSCSWNGNFFFRVTINSQLRTRLTDCKRQVKDIQLLVCSQIGKW